MSLHSLSAMSYDGNMPSGFNKSSTLRCLVNLSHRVGLPFGPIHGMGADHPTGSHPHQIPYSVTICVELYSTLVIALMLLPVTAQLLPRTF
jgi:hypothetical protein